MIKVPLRYAYIFNYGMGDGALDFALGNKDNFSNVWIHTSCRKPKELKYFKLGYELGYQEKYHQTWKEAKHLLFTAVKNKDVEPTDWKISWSINGYYMDDK